MLALEEMQIQHFLKEADLMTTQYITPNLYQLHGQGLHVAYSTTSFDGKPHFYYQDANQHHTFIGDQINRVETELSTIVTVFIRRTIDSGSTSFSLLVPRVNLLGHETLNISTVGITTVHRFSVIPAFDHGQLDTYTVTKLDGTAESVVF